MNLRAHLRRPCERHLADSHKCAVMLSSIVSLLQRVTFDEQGYNQSHYARENNERRLRVFSPRRPKIIRQSVCELMNVSEVESEDWLS